MFSIRKRLLIAAAVTAAVILLFSCCFSALAASKSSPGYYTIVVDAGHGGIDPGVLGVNTKVKESHINLLIARQLRQDFENAGFNVVLTREDEGGLYGLPTQGFKQRDMRRRKEIIEQARPAAMISIHQNNFLAQPSRRGGQVFYAAGKSEGKSLAEGIQKELNALNEAEHSALTGDYYMLNCTDYPSVIVECGFLSNAQDESLLLTEEYRDRLADAIFRGTLAWLASRAAL